MMLCFVLGALALGVCACLQATTNALLAARIGLGAAILINALVVLAGSLALFFATPRAGPATPAPWWFYLGGLCGGVLVIGAALLFPRLGAGPTTALMITAQLALALVFDHLAIAGPALPVTPARVMGLILLLAGALLVLWPRLAA